MNQPFALWEAMECATEILGRRGSSVYWFTPENLASVGNSRLEVARFAEHTSGRIDWIGDNRRFAPCHSIVFELNDKDKAWIAQHEFTPLYEVENTKAWLAYFVEQLASVEHHYELYNGRRNRPIFGTFNEFTTGKVQ